MIHLDQNMIREKIETLNPDQQKAVLHKFGPAVVFAGAGSGKTRVIITRIASLVSQGVHPSSILAVTFTNKAAKEMRERLRQIDPELWRVQVGTFHSACARWLREFSSELGFSSDFTIYDDKDSLQAVKTILKEFQEGLVDESPRVYLNAIARAKTEACLPVEAEKLLAVNPDFFPALGVEVYKKYQAYLISCNAMDFSDLLMNMLILLRSHKLVRKTLQNRFRYILIDEYQDTNQTQFSLINLLVGDDNNLFVVGDDDQSIYSWRGARPHNIINFEDSYPTARVYQLEQNYRSSGCIVEAASKMIQKNKVRSPKTLWTRRDFGEKIEYKCEYDAETESWYVADSIEEEKHDFTFDNVAILYRTNAQSRQMEDTLRRKKIPYRIYGSLRFYDRAEVKDLLGYCRILVNCDDDIAFRRVINLPPRGIGKKAIELVEQIARTEDLSLFAAAKKLVTETPSRSTVKIAAFLSLVDSLNVFLEKNLLEDFLPFLLEKIAYRPFIEKKYPEQLQDKLSNIHELGAAISEYAEEASNIRLANWLKETALVDNERTENDFEEGEEVENVHMMTLHAAKGLEFSKVYVLGVEDGLIPHTNSLEDPQSLEEERRLLYVGMTRAEKKLVLMSAGRRPVLNNWVSYPVSRFLLDIPRTYFKDDVTGLPEIEEEISFEEGDLVYHNQYKSGMVKDLGENSSGAFQVLVEFKFYGLRKVDPRKIKKIKVLKGTNSYRFDHSS